MNHFMIDQELFRSIPADLMLRYGFVPYRRDGKAIVIVSSDLPELLGICHRIVVFSNWAIAGEVARAEFSQERILELAYRGYVGQPAPALAELGPAALPGA